MRGRSYLASGTRLLEKLGGAEVGLEQAQVVEAPGVAHLRYRHRLTALNRIRPNDLLIPKFAQRPA